jgi:DNA-binding winged helix-turn-helix (wHTH) protein/tetratricopeptide (TPR) repeat protein
LPQLRFDRFLLDPARRELRRDDELLNLPPKVFDCIAYLAEHRERAVGRDELIAAVWGRTEVADNLLDQIMLRARRALGDTDGERRVIRTVPRFGFSWVAPTVVIEDAAPGSAPPDVAMPSPAPEPAPPPEADAAAMPPAARPRRRRWLAVAAALVAFAVIGAALRWSTIVTRDAPTGASNRLGLLLPVTIEGEARYAWARLGAMDLIADRLRGSGQPMLPSDNVIALLRGRGGDAAPADATVAQELARATAAGLVLDARAQQSGGYWRVSVRSLHGREPPLLVEGEARDLLEAARAAADRAARALGLTPPADGDLLPPRERALAGLLQQVDAARLADQPDTARALLDSLDAEQRALPEVRSRRAAVDFQSGHLDAAQKEYEDLLGSASVADDPLLHARVLNGLGNIFLRRDDYPAVERSAEQSIVLLERLAPSVELGNAFVGRAIARSAQFRFDQAVADFAQARVVFESTGDRFGIARVDANLGILEARRDRYAEALPLLEGSAERLATFHDLSSELFVRVAASYAHLALLDPAAALAGEPRLGELVGREPNPQYARYATLARVDALDANGRLAQARTLLQGVLEEAGASGDEPLLGSARIIAARMALAAGDAAQAAQLSAAALEKTWEAETPRERAGAWLVQVRAQLAQGSTQTAANVAKMGAWATTDQAPAARLLAALAAAEQSAAAGETAAAGAAYEQALAQAEAARVPEDLLEVCASYAGWLIRGGDLARAGAVAARVASWAPRSYDAALLQLRLYQALGQPAPMRNALAQVRRLAGERVLPPSLQDEATVKR